MEIVELITTHLPVPGIDIMKKTGFLAWSEQEGPKLIGPYFEDPDRGARLASSDELLSKVVFRRLIQAAV